MILNSCRIRSGSRRHFQPPARRAARPLQTVRPLQCSRPLHFTLIELLVVVAIIAILAAIAIPNFLEAQTRSRVSRAKADFRSIATAIEAYAADSNAYPPGYQTAPRHGLMVLTSPISYISNAYPFDPFRPPGFFPEKSAYTYELMNEHNRVVEQGGGPYSVDPASPGDESPRGSWWYLVSRGPNNTFGYKSGEPEYNLRERFFNAQSNPGGVADAVYDATNGTVSNGNLYRAGGGAPAVFFALFDAR